MRHSLRELGLARSETMSETEDHIASLCEVMRYLIAGEDAGTSNLAAQRRFFDAHLRGWVDALCNAIEAHPDADFYAALARFTRDFFAVEGAGVRPARCLSRSRRFRASNRRYGAIGKPVYTSDCGRC